MTPTPYQNAGVVKLIPDAVEIFPFVLGAVLVALVARQVYDTAL